jgi:hypothetical protein
MDGNYTPIVGQIARDRAALDIALDLPRWRVMSRITRRTIRRVITRTELWNGNKEEWRDLLKLQPENNSLIWSWTQHSKVSPAGCRRAATQESAIATNCAIDITHPSTP